MKYLVTSSRSFSLHQCFSHNPLHSANTTLTLYGLLWWLIQMLIPFSGTNICISYLLLQNKLSQKLTSLKQQFLRIKSPDAIYLGFPGLASPMRLQSNCQVCLSSSQGSTDAGGSGSKLHHMSVSRPQLLTNCWPTALVSHYVDLSIGCSHMASCLSLSERWNISMRKPPQISMGKYTKSNTL